MPAPGHTAVCGGAYSVPGPGLGAVLSDLTQSSHWLTNRLCLMSVFQMRKLKLSNVRWLHRD